MKILKKIKTTIEKHDLISREDRILVAVSGGPDSVALLRLLIDVASDYKLHLAGIHFNHRLRGDESWRDEAFVAELCRKMGLQLYIGRAEDSSLDSGQKFSELKARNQRYAYFTEIVSEFAADRVALGHNADDQAETVLLKLLRGSGVGGLKGMLPSRDGLFIRPLLEVGRREILTFLRQEGLVYLQDSSNGDDKYLRNRVRNHLIPYLKKNFEPQVERHLLRLSEIARAEDEYLQIQTRRSLAAIQTDHPGGIAAPCINIELLLSYHEAIVRRVVREMLRSIIPSDKERGYVHVAPVVEFIKKRVTGARMILSRDWQIETEGRIAFFTDPRLSLPMRRPEERGYCYDVVFPGRIKIPETNRTWSFDVVDRSSLNDQYAREGALYLDYEKIKPPLLLRTRRAGDRISLEGMSGSKSIKEYFIDRKIPREERLLVPLLVDSVSVVAIGNERVNSRVAVTEATRRLGRIQII